MDNTFESSLTAISIGSGICGLERGIEQSGARLNVLSYVEIESFIIENLVAKMEAGLLAPAVIWSDAKTFPSHLFRGKVNLLLAGYPCQPFSNAGKRKGTEDPRHLYPYIERTIDIIRPDICFFENVRGHVTLGLREVIASLECLGYRVHWGIFSAEETGASHKRERVFIMAIKEECLDNTSSNGFESEYKIQTRRNSAEYAGVANSNNGSVTNLTKRNEKNGKGEVLQQRNIRKKLSESGNLANTEYTGLQRHRRQCELSGSGREVQIIRSGDDKSKLANPHSSGSWQDSEQSELRTNCFIKPSFNCWRTITTQTTERQIGGRWVAVPGQPQYEWEEPRVITREAESLVGLSTHGYNFREDVLRALGNSVYADTAELAWRTLWNKF